jgi:ATPases of the AAA+ class
MDMTMYGALFTVIVSGIKMISVFEMSQVSGISFTLCYYHYLFLCCLGGGILFMFRDMVKIYLMKLFYSHYNTLSLNKVLDINIYLTYISQHKEFFDTPKSYSIGEACSTKSELILSDHSGNGVPVWFRDYSFKMYGYYVFETIEKTTKSMSDGKEHSSTTFSPNITIYFMTSSHLVPLEYFSKIKEYYNTLQSTQLQYIKVIKPTVASKITNNTFCFQDEPHQDIKVLEGKYIDTFFHPQRSMIWNQIKTLQYNPKTLIDTGGQTQLGYLFHGPPGTGKSSFAFRVASCLHRHIISLDLSMLTRIEAHMIFKTPCVLEQTQSPSKIVFVLDEFDKSITVMNRRELFKEKLKESYLKGIMSGGNNVKVNQDEDNSLLTISDLLELLQGPVPISGAIIIATTNNFEEIKSICPSLIRAGRLTPILFGFPSGKTVNEMSEYYFQKRVNVLDTAEANVCCSEMLSAVSEAKMDTDKGFSWFQQKISKYFS